jgi:hypothetical protein
MVSPTNRMGPKSNIELASFAKAIERPNPDKLRIRTKQFTLLPGNLLNYHGIRLVRREKIVTVLIKSFQIKNYMSFDDSGQQELSPHINIVVGQNNSGRWRKIDVRHFCRCFCTTRILS